MPAAIEFDGITKEYRGFWAKKRIRALDGFSLKIETGEIFGFLGQNGAGKTTAIHLAMGFMRPSSGHGRMLGFSFGHALTRRQVGFLAENVALYHRNADALVRFYGALNGMGGVQLSRSTQEALESVGLTEQQNRNVSKYSRGMLQRVGLAQALVNDPKLLILDEPTSALDPIARVAVRELLLNLRNAGKTIFISSHLLSEVELICDRVGILHKGRLVRVGSTKELLEAGGEIEIVAKGVAADLFSNQGVTAASVNGTMTFALPAKKQRESLERIWNAGGEVISVNPARHSLEQMFMQATSQNEKSTEVKS
jgi:ABC-2 type transport system ATP-binding protein